MKNDDSTSLKDRFINNIYNLQNKFNLEGLHLSVSLFR
jgi:hypothetical protein